MPLEAGRKLGPYEIVAPIGKGGMGEVYRARDTKLERDVALKVLPEEFADDKERLTRFEREAKLLASLNHPNIASIHGFEDSDGVKALVLELVEGPTLAERIQQSPIPVDEAIAIAKQIAEALEAGHEAGVIHRDLKPANIKLKEDGAVKVLDYGLAKAFEGNTTAATDSELSQSPTLTRQGTQIGVILGTAAYMSPEQATGKRVDQRTDIFAFGTVLFEMLSGKRAFAGKEVSATLAAVLRAEPDLDSLPAETPESLCLVLRLCLSKDVRERFQSIGDVRLALEGAFETSTTQQGAVSQPVSWRTSMGTLAAAALLLSVGTGVAVWNLKPDAPRPVVRFSLPLPPGVSLTGMGVQVVAFSPDGTRLVYSANDQLYHRAIDRTEATPVRGTERDPSGPFFSPDGEWVGFYSNSGGELMKVAIRGGAPVSLCETPRPYGARWGADDTIIFGQRGAGIMQVPADGGTPEILIPLTAATAGVGHGPQVLPDAKAVLFTLGDGANWDDAQIVAHSLETGERKTLIDGARDARYVPSGHLVYVSGSTLLAVPFDVDKLEVTGRPVAIAEGVMTAGGATGAAYFGVSDTGAVAYVRDLGDRTLVWMDRDGREEVLAAEPRAYTYPRISPDGGRLALWVRDQESDIWIWDFTRETLTRLTFAPGRDSNPVWTPDGRRVAFASARDGTMNLYWKAADGTDVVEQLTKSDNLQVPYTFTPDGRQLVFLEIEQSLDLRVLSPEGSSKALLATAFRELNGEISPDGRWLAYQSNASGHDEIYVRPFPNVEDRQWLISNGGGTRPLWAPDGRELFYLAPGARLMTVGVQSEPSFAPGNAEELFGGVYSPGVASGRTYDISPDGQRFLMIKESAGGDSTAFVVVLNGFEEFK